LALALIVAPVQAVPTFGTIRVYSSTAALEDEVGLRLIKSGYNNCTPWGIKTPYFVEEDSSRCF
jgi:hypothetical protein